MQKNFVTITVRSVGCKKQDGIHRDKTMAKALIAMSGGVDSSVAAALMKKKGYDCIGAMMKLYQNEDIADAEKTCCVAGNEMGEEKSHCAASERIKEEKTCCAVSGERKEQKTCCTAEDAEDAAAVARKLGMPFYVFRFTEEFRHQVMERFVNSYLNGETPNPCIDCNRYMKFEKLYERALLLGCDKIATGHYARVAWDEESGRWQMRMAVDKTKDQSYVLSCLTQEQLSHTCFPLGELTKDEVRQLARNYGFYNADKQDSQDICFVPDGHYEKFIEKYTGKRAPEGNFIAEDGKVLGRHKGIVYYTIGQRKGLGIATAYPYYVKEIRAETNEVVLCVHEKLFQKTLYARDVNWISIPEPNGEIRVQAKIRYRHAAQPATAKMTENGLLKVTFDEPQRAITKGQAVVLYEGDLVLGGGKICGAE